MNTLTRRQFLSRTTAAVGTATLAFPYVGRVLGANGRVSVACIGVGGKGDGDSSDVARAGCDIVGICDVDQNTLDKKARQFPKAKQFKDYRKMLEKIGSEVDAVTVSTPDHNHGVAAIRAMKMGKHIYCQKPLVQTVHEARIVRGLANEKKLVTQMGNQGSSSDGLRRAVEVIQAGIIGNPLEVHVWTNRPIWPQGIDRPPGEDPVPPTLDWDCWIGPAKMRPFKKGVYHPFAWRGWYDFGTGALGDMACHTVNMPFRACKMGYPDVVEYELGSRIYPETFPKTSRIRYEFPEREGLPRLKFWWYDGNPDDALKPLRPEANKIKEIIMTQGNLPGSGALIIGEKGKIFSPDDYGEHFYVAMKGEDEFTSSDKHDAVKKVPQTLPRNPDARPDLDYAQHAEWVRAIKDGNPDLPYSRFDIAAYLAEVILLGSVALRVGEGRRIEWDGPNMKSPNLPESAQFTTRNNREGWEA